MAGPARSVTTVRCASFSLGFWGHEVKNLGDGRFLRRSMPSRAIRCAAAITDAVRSLGIAVRSGLHTGDIELTTDDVGIAVHIAARVAAEADAGETVLSSTVRDLVAGSGLCLKTAHPCGLGITGNMHLYTVLHASVSGGAVSCNLIVRVMPGCLWSRDPGTTQAGAGLWRTWSAPQACLLLPHYR